MCFRWVKLSELHMIGGELVIISDLFKNSLQFKSLKKLLLSFDPYRAENYGDT